MNVRFCAEPAVCDQPPYFYSVGRLIAEQNRPIGDCHLVSHNVDNQLDAELGWIDYHNPL